ncbi:MAG: prephenate dehydratase [Actinomycetia bacterium]|nr:prephenate dehydratase [Actinomycetes bacterium]
MTTFAFLGPQGTYSDEAARLFAQSVGTGSEAPAFAECATITEVFAAVGAGEADFGVVPIENSLEGSVNTTLDELAFGRKVLILGEKLLDIHHCVAVASGSSKQDITTVVSHPQATGQCAQWISHSLPGRPIVAANSTADAVRQAVEHPGYAAIASVFAAELYGADILECSIEDHANNQTLFALIASEEVAASWQKAGRDPLALYKTSVALFQQKNRPGALLMILSEFAYAGINLTRIQSRPTKQAMGEYMFFLDFEGHEGDPEIQIALESLRLKLREVKVLGSYPAA